LTGLNGNAGKTNKEQRKFQGVKMQEQTKVRGKKMQNMTLTDENARGDIAGCDIHR